MSLWSFLFGFSGFQTGAPDAPGVFIIPEKAVIPADDPAMNRRRERVVTVASEEIVISSLRERRKGSLAPS
jgi:hypothetical protein